MFKRGFRLKLKARVEVEKERWSSRRSSICNLTLFRWTLICLITVLNHYLEARTQGECGAEESWISAAWCSPSLDLTLACQICPSFVCLLLNQSTSPIPTRRSANRLSYDFDFDESTLSPSSLPTLFYVFPLSNLSHLYPHSSTSSHLQY